MPAGASVSRQRRLSYATSSEKYGKYKRLRSSARRRPGKAAPRQLDDLTDATRRRTGAEVVGHALGVLQLAEQEDRIGDKVDRYHVDWCLAARRQGEVGAARECTQRPVQDVERRRPSRVALPHDDARPKHGDRQLLAPPRDQLLGLELRLLISVAKALADVE